MAAQREKSNMIAKRASRRPLAADLHIATSGLLVDLGAASTKGISS